MYARLLLLLSISIILSALYFNSQHSGMSEIRERLRIERVVIDDRIVRLEINTHLCSGFVVAKDLLATASHCVLQKEPLELALVDFLDGTKAPFEVVAAGGLYAGNDWALIKADTKDIESMPFNIAPPMPGMIVATVGHPHGVLDQIMTFGMVMQVNKMIVVASINYPGESGSPLIDQSGQVLGILSAVNLQTPVTYVTPIDVLAKKLFQLGYVQ